MVRESKDHGPWNSWDRVPYITTLRNGTASTVRAGAVQKGTRVLISLWDSLMFGRVPGTQALDPTSWMCSRS